MSGCGGDGGSGDSIEEGTTSYNSSQEEAEGNTSSTASGRNRDKSRSPKKRHQSRPVSSKPVNLKRTTAGSHSISQKNRINLQIDPNLPLSNSFNLRN